MDSPRAYGPITVSERHEEWSDLPEDEQARLLARQGQAYVVADLVRVVGEEMADVPREGAVIGEVAMRGNNVMKEYYLNPESTSLLAPEERLRQGRELSFDL